MKSRKREIDCRDTVKHTEPKGTVADDVPILQEHFMVLNMRFSPLDHGVELDNMQGITHFGVCSYRKINQYQINNDSNNC